jgi:hypothetical protein
MKENNMAFANPTPQGASPKPPYKIAFVIDDVVADTIHVPDRLAAVLLSEPKIVLIPDELEEQVIPGWKYNETDGFIDDKDWQLVNEEAVMRDPNYPRESDPA